MANLPKDFVVTAIIVKEQSVLLVKHRKLGLWLPIGGHIDEGEDPIQALEREIAEESGVSVELVAEKHSDAEWGEVRALPVPAQLQVEYIDGKHEHIDLIYFAKYLEGKARLAEGEHHDIKWFSIDEIESDKTGFISQDVKFLARKAVEAVNPTE